MYQEKTMYRNACHLQTFSHKVILNTPHHCPDLNMQLWTVIDTDCIGRYKSNYHMITAITTLSRFYVSIGDCWHFINIVHVLGTGESSQGSDPHSCSGRPGVAKIVRALSMRGYQVIMQTAWPWTIVGYGFGVPLYPHAKEFFCKFRKRKGALYPLHKTEFFIPSQLSILFPCTLSNNQSINY